MAHSYYKERDYSFAASAIACVYYGVMYPKLAEALRCVAGVGVTSFYKYRQLLRKENSSLSFDDLSINLVGNRLKYSAKVDAQFGEWLKSSDTT